MIEARRGEANVTADTRWITHQETADHLGVKVESARRRAQREGWPRLSRNDGKARVGIPGDAAAQGDASGPMGRDDDRPGEVAALREALARARERADRAEAAAAVVPELREKAAWAEGERDVLQEALQAAEAAAAHQRAAKLTAVLGRAAEGLERIQKTQASTAEAVAACKAEREAALARVEEAALRAGEAEARAAEASRRAAAAKTCLDHLQQLRAEAAQIASLEAEARRPLWQRIFRRRTGQAT